MSNIIHSVIKNKKIIVITLLTLLCLPLITTLVEIIFTYGTYVGGHARSLIEGKICK
jgi:hypothetical protein